jgi:hypothetical protein
MQHLLMVRSSSSSWRTCATDGDFPRRWLAASGTRRASIAGLLHIAFGQFEVW